MSKEDLKIIRGSRSIEYSHGTKEYDYECDVCHESNYPIFSWPTDDDPYIHAFICTQCATEMMRKDAT